MSGFAEGRMKVTKRKTISELKFNNSLQPTFDHYPHASSHGEPTKIVT
jgi:hypothetical protein